MLRSSKNLLAQALELNIGNEAKIQDLPYAVGTNAFGDFLGNTLKIIMIIAALLVFISIILAAIDYITAGGEKGKLESARNKITGAIIGLIILASSLALFLVVQSMLGIEVIQVRPSITPSKVGPPEQKLNL